MLFPLTSAVVLLGFVLTLQRDRGRSPLVLALGGWLASLVLASPLLFSYAVDYRIVPDAFLATALLFAAGTYLALRKPHAGPVVASHRPAIEVRVAVWFGVIAVLGSLLLLVDAALTRGLQFSFSSLTTNASEIRDETFDATAAGANRGLVGTFGSFIAPAAIPTIIAAVRLRADGGQLLRLLAVANFVLITAVSLLVFAGRATMVNLILMALVAAYLAGRRFSFLSARTLIGAVLLLAGGWYFSTTFFANREDTTNALRILENTQRAQLRPWVYDAATSNQSFGLAAVNVGYFASPIPTFTYYMQQPNLPGPFYGRYSFPLPARVAGTAYGTWTRSEWNDIRVEVFDPLETRGYFGNVWSTWLRDLFVDFGYFGAVLFSALAGALLAGMRNRYERTGALHYLYVETVVCFSVGFGAFTSFLFDPFVFLGFVYGLIAMVLVRATGQRRPRAQAAAAVQFSTLNS